MIITSFWGVVIVTCFARAAICQNCVLALSRRSSRIYIKFTFCASTTVSLHYVWHGSLLSRSFIACNLCVEVVVVCSAFSCECDCCSWVLVSISCNHILDVTPPYNSGFLKWNHMIFNELKNW